MSSTEGEITEINPTTDPSDPTATFRIKTPVHFHHSTVIPDQALESSTSPDLRLVSNTFFDEIRTIPDDNLSITPSQIMGSLKTIFHEFAKNVRAKLTNEYGLLQGIIYFSGTIVLLVCILIIWKKLHIKFQRHVVIENNKEKNIPDSRLKNKKP